MTVSLLDTLTRRRAELDAQHQRDTDENTREAAARQAKIDLAYRSRLAEIDLMLEAVGSLPEPSGAPAPPGSSEAPAAPGAPAARASSGPAPQPAPGAGGRSRRTSTGSRPSPRRSVATKEGARKAGSGAGKPASRVASSLGELVPRQVFDIMRKQGYIASSELQSMYGVKRVGPVLSAWRRTARTLGADLSELILKGSIDGTDTRVYRITEVGREALAPGSDLLDGPGYPARAGSAGSGSAPAARAS